MVNSRESLAKIPSMNNDANPYIITLDIYKEGYWAYDISNYYKGRVDDNGTPFMVRWFEHGQLKNVQGLRPFIRGTVGQHTVDDQTDPDNPKVVPSPDCSQIDQTGETTDTAPGGIAIYRMVNQCFTQEGMFYGEIGLKDSSGLVLSSVDIAFKVLGGRMNMIGARKFYVSEFEKSLADLKERLEQHDKDYDQKLAGKISEFDNKTNKVIDDARNTFMAETKDAHDSLDALKSEIRANRAEQENLTNHLAGTEQQIEIHDIPTRPEFEAQNARIDEKLDSMNLNIESYKDLDAVKAKYPNGSSNLIVTDDGYRAIWNGTEWIKGSAFVAAELKDKCVVPTKVSNIAISQVTDDAIDWNEINYWYSQPNEFTYTKNDDGTLTLSNQVAGNHGITLKGSADALNNKFYVNLFVEPLLQTNTSTVDIYLVKNDGSITPKNEIITESANTSGYYNCIINKSDFSDCIVNGYFKLLVAIHDTDEVKIKLSASNFAGSKNLNAIEKKVNYPDLIDTTTLDKRYWRLWGDNTKNTLKNNNSGLFFKQNDNNDQGFYLNQSINVSRDIFITVTFQSNNNASFYLMKDISSLAQAIELTPSGGINSPVNYDTEVFKVTKEQIKAKDITDQATLLIATHNKGTCVQIKDLDISNTPGSRYITEKINDLYKQNEIGFTTQVGDIDLVTTSVSMPKVHFIAPRFINNKDNQIITKINVLAKQPGKMHFKVGTIDQHSLLVNDIDYYLTASQAGLNSFKVNIPLNSGQTLLLDISDDMANLYQLSDLADGALIQDEDHVYNSNGYSGMNFYAVDNSLPFEFYYQNKDKNAQINKNSDDINSLKQEMISVSNKVDKKNKLIVSDDKDFKYQIKVSNGSLVLNQLTPDKVVILGNSLTRERGDIGMNASDADHDYYHYVTEYIKSQNPNAVINPRTNVSSWEQADDNPPTAEREKVFNDTIKPLLSADTNLVIIQLGDNVNNDVRISTLPNDARELIQEIKSISPKATIFWIYGWFGDQEKVDKPIKEACEAEDVQGIDISDLNIKENQGTMGSTFTGLDGKTYTVDNPGIAAHPGDKGHKAIADRVISNFDF